MKSSIALSRSGKSCVTKSRHYMTRESRYVTTMIFCLAVVLIMLTCFSSQTFAAGGAVEWTYNSAVIGKQESRAMAVDSSGNVVLAGFVEAASSDYHTIKVLADGSGLAWPAKAFDLAGAPDLATAVAVDGNDDIIVTGYVHNGSNYDIHTIKYSGADGSLIWQHTFNGSGGGNDFANAIVIDSLNNIYIGGTMQNASGKDDFVVVKYVPAGPNPDDTPTWSVSYNGPDDAHDRLTAIAVGVDGIAVTGESQNAASDFDFVVVKFALDGVKGWEKRYSDSGNGKGLDVALDASGDVIATGYVDNGSDRDHYTVKYPSIDGPAVWVKIRDRGYDDEGRSLWLDSAGNVYVTGTSFTLTTNKDLTVTRYAAADGNDTAPDGWHVDYNTINGNSDVGVDTVGDDSGDIFVTGITNDNAGGFDDIHTYKFCKETGAMLWFATHGVLSKHDRPVGLELAPDGHPIMAGWSDTDSTGYDFIAVKYNAGALDAPTSLIATTVSTSEISLTWADNSDNEENFVVERKNGSNDWVTVTSSLSADTTSYNDTGLTADHRYYYRVKATNAADGSSPYSNEVNARTTIISYVPPAWQHQYAGIDGGDDEPVAIAVGPDNHPVATGYSFAFEGGYDYYTIKLDRADAAVEQWSARYNDGDNESDFARAVAVDSSNRAVVSGYASLYGGGTGNTNDIYTLSYPADGSTPTWTHQYNGPSGNDDRSAAVATAVDGSDNTVVVGYGKNATLDNDIYVIKYSADGTPQTPLWASTPYDRGGDDQPAAVAYDPNGDIFVAGKSWNGSDFDYFVAKYNGSDGSLAWGGAPRFYNGTGNSTDYANSLAVDGIGNLYVTGYSVGSAGNGDIVTLKYEGTTGNIMPGWPKVYDGGGYDTGASIGIDIVNNDVVVAGTTFVGPGNHDVMVVRYTPDGNEVWSKFLDFTGGDEAAAAMSIDRTGVACVTAATDSGSGDDIVSVMFDHSGLIVGANIFDGAAGGVDYPSDVVFNTYGEAFVAGATTNAGNNTDFIIFKTTSTVVQAPSPLTAALLYSEADLSWADNSLDETGFRIERKTGSCSDAVPWVPVTETAANVTGYLASGLNPGNPYCFRAQSFNDLGEASRWVEVDVVTVAAEPPDGLSATVLNTTDILIEWNDLTTGETGFNLQRCQGAGCDFSVHTNIPLPAETISYVDAEVCEGETYKYQINTYKTGQWVSDYGSSTPDVLAASMQAPTALTSDWVSEEWVELKWTDNSGDETEFLIERCAGGGCSNFAALDTLTSPAGNVLYLRMDEAAWSSIPGEVVDLSATGNHGQAYGSATTTSDGKYANAGVFNGSSAYLSTPLMIDQAEETSQGASFAAWIYPASTSANNHFVIGTDDGGNDWSLLRNAGSWYVANGIDDALVNTGIAVTINSWHHMAVVFDAVSGVTLYQDGVAVWSNAAIDFDDSSAAVHIGRRGSLNQEFFDGRLDEVSAFNRTLTAAEVGVLYDHGLGRYNDLTVVFSTTYNYQVKAYKSSSCDWTSLSS
ncbi:MAG: fibronectin type III domain-containing protein, partial [Desulfuromonadales bacterium]|nr:fibronectin type III domain-containing protein [Desulfuromonadales bacterium]